jgi:hypothetical protein
MPFITRKLRGANKQEKKRGFAGDASTLDRVQSNPYVKNAGSLFSIIARYNSVSPSLLA